MDELEHELQHEMMGLNENISLSGTGGKGFIEFKPQSSNPATPASGFKLLANSVGKLAWMGVNGFLRVFDGTANTADRAYVLPDKSGTVKIDYQIHRIVSGTTATITAADNGKTIVFTSGTAVALTVNSDVQLEGFNFNIIQMGAGQITPSGTATLHNAFAHTKTYGQYAAVTFECCYNGSSYEFIFAGITA